VDDEVARGRWATAAMLAPFQALRQAYKLKVIVARHRSPD
jgi:hypothetical protein